MPPFFALSVSLLMSSSDQLKPQSGRPAVVANNLERSLAFTLKWEGGYSDHPSDPGGATNRGVTQRVYDSHRSSRGLSSRSVSRITESEVKEIYLLRYWSRAHCNGMEWPLCLVMLDTAVNFGTARAIQFLGRAAALGDGLKWTPAHSDAVHNGNQYDLALAICNERDKYRLARVKKAPSQKVFLRGWQRRDKDLRLTVKGFR